MKSIAGNFILSENIFEKSEYIYGKNEDENEDGNEKETWKVHFHTQETPILADFKSVIVFFHNTYYSVYI